MATFDQLPADQRAIIELVLKRGRTYDALSDMLDMPTSRVRELARDALSELAPHTAERVDPDWRDQVADYVLGQQSGPESTATQGHLKRSEPARAWFLSLMDSLDQLYANGRRPELPEMEGERTRARDRRERGGDRARRRDRDREPARAGRDRDRDERDRDGDRDEDDDGKRRSALTGGRAGGPLSPAARAAVKRRRLIAGVAALLVVVAVVLAVTGVIGDDGGGDSGDDQAADTTQASEEQQTQLVGQLQLDRVRGGGGGRDTVGIAGILKTGDKEQLAVQAKLPPRTGEKEAYEVWLYNSRRDAVSVGAQRTDEQGNYQGASDPLPGDWRKYKYVDVSVERIDQNAAHSGRSILRGELSKMEAPPPQQQPGAGEQGGGQQGGGGAAPQQP